MTIGARHQCSRFRGGLPRDLLESHRVEREAVALAVIIRRPGTQRRAQVPPEQSSSSVRAIRMLHGEAGKRSAPFFIFQRSGFSSRYFKVFLFEALRSLDTGPVCVTDEITREAESFVDLGRNLN